jgi:hypothetical protein
VAVCLAGPVLLPAKAEAPMTDTQVKALCLLNFAKYVEWPTNAFPYTNSPILIVLQGDGPFTTALQSSIKDRTIDGRRITIQVLHSGDAIPVCHILFVSSAESSREPGILKQLNGRPVLTVGEAPSFAGAGGMINFVVRNGKVRFDINMDSARKAGLRISSNLLQLADTVSDKPQ